MKLVLEFVCLISLAVVPASCAGEITAPHPPQGQSSAAQVVNYPGLMSKFRAAGTPVEAAGNVEQPFLSVRGRMIKIYGEDVQVFEYPGAAAMEAEAARISPDGGAVGTRKIFWVGLPHFFKAGRVLVLYVGNNDKALKTLEDVLGRQFAGQ